MKNKKTKKPPENHYELEHIKDMIHDIEILMDEPRELSFGSDYRSFFDVDDSNLSSISKSLESSGLKELVKDHEEDLHEILEPITYGLANFVVYLIKYSSSFPRLTIRITDNVGAVIMKDFEDDSRYHVVYFYQENFEEPKVKAKKGKRRFRMGEQ